MLHISLHTHEAVSLAALKTEATTQHGTTGLKPIPATGAQHELSLL